MAKTSLSLAASLAIVAGACTSPSVSPAPATPIATALPLTCDRAVPLARAFMAKAPGAEYVHLEAPQIADGGTICQIMFRRKQQMVAPAVITVSVDKLTGDLRFSGDE